MNFICKTTTKTVPNDTGKRALKRSTLVAEVDNEEPTGYLKDGEVEEMEEGEIIDEDNAANEHIDRGHGSNNLRNSILDGLHDNIAECSQSSSKTLTPDLPTKYDQSRQNDSNVKRLHGNRKRRGNHDYSSPIHGKKSRTVNNVDLVISGPTRRNIKEKADVPSQHDFEDHHPYSRRPTHFLQRGLLGIFAFLEHTDCQPDEVAMTLGNRSDELDYYLYTNDNCPHIVQLLIILKKCAEAKLCKQTKLKVMYTLRKRKMFERKDVLEKLKGILASLQEDTEDDFMFCVLFVMKTMIHTVGLEEGDILIALSVMKMMMQNHDTIFARERELLNEIEDHFSKKTRNSVPSDDTIEHFGLTLPILPDIEMIRAGTKINIPQHTVGKEFSSEQGYVSYMYAVFREDFVRPLVNGIKTYIAYHERRSTERFFSTDVRLYKNIYLVSTSTQIENGIVWKVQFPSTFSRRSYIPSVLQYGSLLCLSHDNFRSIYYATVANRDLSQLRKGQVDVKFVGHFDLPNPLEETFIMLESRAFYGAYLHTLLSLQILSSGLACGETTLPMGKYLTGQTDEVNHPAYLEKCRHLSFECLKHYGETNNRSWNVPSSIDVTNTDTWPSASELGMDLSQYQALKLVLKNEVALIQGPPGTGKTMMGIRITELLITNKGVWDGERDNDPRPLLLVSYTNHALDQFLQLLLDTPTMKDCLSEDVVRVGSRCEVKELDQYALKTHRRNRASMEYKNRFRVLKDIERKREALTETISSFQSNLIHEKTFHDRSAMTVYHYMQLQRGKCFGIPPNITLLWTWLNLKTFASANENLPEDAFTDENCVTVDDMTLEDNGRILDDLDDVEYYFNWDLMPRGLLRAIDEKILREDPFFRSLSSKQHSMILKGIKNHLQVKERMNYEEMMTVQNIWKLTMQERWRLYRYWVHEATAHLFTRLKDQENLYEDASKQYCEVRNVLDCLIMKNAKIVAMTTTAASRYTDILREVGSPIVMIEEAAQVSEQHVLGSLSPACQHLIMIGDHQQLKPAYNDYSLTKTHNTDVSLFERLVCSKIPYQQLENQHRMRPEISMLLVPHIYKTLNDDASVFGYPNIRGMTPSVFFVSHTEMEDVDDESLSHSNTFEAEFLTMLYRHLRLQGYRSSEITILAPYKDQVQVLRRLIREKEKSDFILLNCFNEDTDTLEPEKLKGIPKKDEERCGVRITPIDNFQGEENKIILLSLVRSNRNGSIGHLSAANRVCVSLSRAKEGFYVIGNFNCLRKASSLWDDIVSNAEKKGIIGESLELKCSKHTTHKMVVETAKDFEKFKDGGCSQPCNTRLECGHTCSRKCHTGDAAHRIPCQKACVKYCPRGHAHERNCDEPIGKCRNEIEVELPFCGHKVMIECFKDLRDIKCKERCMKTIPCGHVCQRHCGEICNTERDCNDLVKVTGKCGHTFQIACSKQRDGLCTVKCTSTLACGHPCRGTCGKCHAGRLHMPCSKKCERKLICGHPCKADCTEVCPPCSKPCLIRCVHSNCNDVCGQVCTPCREPCKWECRRNCKNQFKCTKLCSEQCNRERCNLPCRRRMPCGHQCIALKCEECFCRECSDKSEFEIFFGTEDDADAVFYRLPDCGHILEVTSLDKYMDGDTSAETIAMKTCPRCTNPIWNSQRYGNIVRQKLKDIDAVKSKLLTVDVSMMYERRNLSQQFHKLEDKDHKRLFEESLKKTKNTAQIDALRMQFGFYENVTDSMKNLSQIYCHISEEKGKELKQELTSLLDWVLIKRFRFSQQELHEFKIELTRIRLSYRTLLIQNTLSMKDEVPEEEQSVVDKALEKLCNGSKVDERELQSFENQLKVLETKYPRSGLMITEEERIMIIRAMGFGEKGHWYKCKNGHVYAIGDCGGATIEGTCPECAETIGGGGHRLRDDNSLASEMDGAQFSAWSEQANMQNYMFDDHL